MNKKNFFRVLIVLATCFLVACSTSNTAERCLPSLVKTVPETMGLIRDEPRKNVIPQGEIASWWNVLLDSSSPLSITPQDNPFWGVNDIAVQKNGTIWVARSIFQYGIKVVNTNDIWRYDPVTNKSLSYQIKSDDNTSTFILDLLNTSKGELWGLVVFPEDNRTSLVHYNSQADRFEFAPFTSGHELILQTKDNRDYNFFVSTPILGESPDGNILMPFGKNIISYNPFTHESKKLLPEDFPNYISTIVVYDNKVWFTTGRIEASTLDVNGQDRDLRSVDLQAGKLINYGHAPSILDDKMWFHLMKASYRPIAVDKLGRIWMGYFSRLTLGQNGKYTWEKITYPPEFVVTDDPDYQYLWAQIYWSYTSSDGNLWFNTSAGLVQYNINQDKWCRSTPVSGSAVMTEDNNHSLWMALVNNKNNGYIYRYDLKP